MNPPPSRIARIVLVTPQGAPLGVLPDFAVDVPWWQEVWPLVEGAHARFGVAITVLRMLEVAPPGPDGRVVTYLAECRGPVEAALHWDGELDDQPLRLPYARPGGPAADFAWAAGVLATHGLSCDAPPYQVRTWNLSSLWRLSAGGRRFWLKVTPPFMAHEGALIEALAGGPAPTLMGRDGGRILMPQIPGDDCYGAREPLLSRMVDLIVPLQREWIGRTGELLRLGLNDWRTPALAASIAETFERNADRLTRDARDRLAPFVGGLDARLAEAAACGLPETLVHGDFHPGNLRWDGAALTLLDWGDAGVGHPLLDEPAFLERIPAEDAPRLRERWHAAWQLAGPGSDPARASALLAPVAALRQAVVYQGFLDRIEPSEHPYHRADPPERLARAAELLAAERL
ncbi:MAG TPA: aminoglycoside phosphotransferase family protein [Caulobacteraceae bacterium]|jgi:hypothetical protein